MCVALFYYVCVLLCFIIPILGNRYGPGVNSLLTVTVTVTPHCTQKKNAEKFFFCTTIRCESAAVGGSVLGVVGSL